MLRIVTDALGHNVQIAVRFELGNLILCSFLFPLFWNIMRATRDSELSPAYRGNRAPMYGHDLRETEL